MPGLEDQHFFSTQFSFFKLLKDQDDIRVFLYLFIYCYEDFEGEN